MERPTTGDGAGPDDAKWPDSGTMAAPPVNAVELRGFYAARKMLRDLLDGLEGGLLGIGYERTVETVTHEADDGGFHVRPTGAQVLTLRVNDPRLRAQCIDAVGGRKVLDDGPRPSFLMPEAS